MSANLLLLSSPRRMTRAQWRAMKAAVLELAGSDDRLATLGDVRNQDAKDSVRLATAANLAAYTVQVAAADPIAIGDIRGDANGALTVDGSAVAVGDRLLINRGPAAQASHADQGIWDVILAGGAAERYLLRRSADANTTAKLSPGAEVPVEAGTANADKSFMLVTNTAITPGTTAQQWTETSGTGFALLADLISTANGEGASLVGIEDAATNYTATDVEGALAELLDGTLTKGFNDGVLTTWGTGQDASLSYDSTRNALVASYPGVLLAGLSGLSDRFELKWQAGQQGIPSEAGLIHDVGLRQTIISGLADGDHTVTGIATTDTLVSVLHIDMGGNAETDLTAEFSISGADTINNGGGTSTAADTLIVTYMDASANAALAADPFFELAGVNVSADDVTANAEGGITCQTDGADGDEVIIIPRADTSLNPWNNVTWGTDQEVTWECRIQTGPAITNSIVWAGLKLTNTEVQATDNDQIYIRYEDGVQAGNFEVVESVAGADVLTDSGVTVAVDTTYHLHLAMQADRTVEVRIDGVLVHTTAALTDATDLIPYIGVAADGAAEVKTLNVFSQAISRTYGA